ncbi:MAG: hypothetical protein WEB06_04995 [Actinomycetota bacterium]
MASWARAAGHGGQDRGQIKTVDDPDWASLGAPLLEIEDAPFEPGRALGRKLSLTENIERIQGSDA